MSETCTHDTLEELRRQIEVQRIDSPAEIDRLSDLDFSTTTIYTPEGEVLSVFTECEWAHNQPIKVVFLFEIDAENSPAYGETYIFLNGSERFDDFSFSGLNYASTETAFRAAARYFNNFAGGIDAALIQLQERDFFIHNDYLDEDHRRHVIVVRDPYSRGSLMERAGGNGSPNTPASFCITSSKESKNIIEISRTSECRFNWAAYVDQVGKILTRGQNNGRD